MAPGDLEKVLSGLKARPDPKLISGFEQFDKGVYQIAPNLAIIQTVDFFTPIVDDPYVYGQIAAANSLSDVYAMGGTPITALNIVAFPSRSLDLGILRDILRGGLDKMNEAQTTLVGGHSIEDAEIKYGLAVTGTVEPGKVIRTNGAKPGDQLILTKPLGTGIINTAMKAGEADAAVVAQVQTMMATLNRQAAIIMCKYRVHACTDVTGFGLLGHLCEMLISSGVGAQVVASQVPLFPQALELAQADFVPGGTCRIREFRDSKIIWPEKLGKEYQDLLFDPQTSGGLLMAVATKDAEPLVSELQKNGVSHAKIIGKIVADKQHRCTIE